MIFLDEMTAWDWFWAAFVVVSLHIIFPLVAGRGRRKKKAPSADEVAERERRDA